METSFELKSNLFNVLFSGISLISILKALKVKYEKIEKNENPERVGHTAQIYQDSLYIYGGFGDIPPNQLLKFDLNTLEWTELEPLGEGLGQEFPHLLTIIL